MCTAISLGGFFGRNLDLEGSLGERLVVTPRRFSLSLRALPPLEQHHAIVGTALVRGGFPLYFDAVNECGLAMAGLDFPDCARYHPRAERMTNLAPFELIPFVLGTCATLEEARIALRRVNLWAEPFSPALPLTPLHWLIADRTGAVAAEPTARGLQVLEDPAGVLTNSPGLEEQLAHLSRFHALTPTDRGLGLPGDHTSPSRFVRAAFHRSRFPIPADAQEGVAGCMELLSCAHVPQGSAVGGDGRCRCTVYSACCDLGRGDYYLSPRENRRLTAISLRRAGMEGETLTTFDIPRQQDAGWVN